MSMDTALPTSTTADSGRRPRRPAFEGLFTVPALRASARFHGLVIEETFSRTGTAVEIGPHGALHVPAPEGQTFVARARWKTAGRVEVTDASGNVYGVTADSPARIAAGPVELELTLVPQFFMPRFGALSWGMSLGWLAVLTVATTGVESAGVARDVANTYECAFLGKVAGYSPIFAATFERDCVDHSAAGAGFPGGYTAEYIARLLKEDYAGADQGLVNPTIGEGKESDSYYLPAGDKGPITEMGGAANVAPDPVRSRGTGEDLPTIDVIEAPLESAEGKVADPAKANRLAADGSADAEEGEDGDKPAEEKQGWGVPDWYDAEDSQQDHDDIDEMLRYAKDRLKIDPQDTGALSVLSYYQYLAEDFPDALTTYDKIIDLEPESSAGYNNKALVYKRQGRYEEEEALYRVALALEPEDTTALNNLAVNLAHQHRFDEALAIMNKLEVVDPADPYADLHRAKIAAEQGQDDRSRMFLEKALSGMKKLDTLHHIEFRQDIRVDPSFEKLRHDPAFNAILVQYYGKDTPLQE
jgi:tetratricopeptide (TPR) repeat protein